MALDFPRDLRRLRRSRGQTQSDVAEIVGTSTSTLARWEQRQAIPNARLIPALAEYLGVDSGMLADHLDDLS